MDILIYGISFLVAVVIMLCIAMTFANIEIADLESRIEKLEKK